MHGQYVWKVFVGPEIMSLAPCFPGPMCPAAPTTAASVRVEIQYERYDGTWTGLVTLNAN